MYKIRCTATHCNTCSTPTKWVALASTFPFIATDFIATRHTGHIKVFSCHGSVAIAPKPLITLVLVVALPIP